jgi:hypothetical protein
MSQVINLIDGSSPELSVYETAMAELSVLRQAVADAAEGAYGSKVRYAEGLNLTFGVDLLVVEVKNAEGTIIDLRPDVAGWFDVEHGDDTAAAKPVLTEKTAFYDVLKAKKSGGSNPSKTWGDIRKYGRRHALEQAERVCLAEIAEKKIVMPEGAKREDPLAAESKGANNLRSIRLRMTEDLSELYQAAKRVEKKLTTEEQACLLHVSSALIALGVSLETLAK